MANPLADTEMDYKNKFQMKEMNNIEKRKKNASHPGACIIKLITAVIYGFP